MKYILQVEAEGEDLVDVTKSDRSTWKVISGNPQRPAQPPPPQQGMRPVVFPSDVPIKS